MNARLSNPVPQAPVGFAVAVLLMAACSFSPLGFLQGANDESAPMALRRCDESAEALCLVTFGLEPPDNMVVELSAPSSLDWDIRMVVKHQDEQLALDCRAADEGRTTFYCTGPSLPLGSVVEIEVYAIDQGFKIASGRFVIAAYALPSPGTGPTSRPQTPIAISTPASTTPLPTTTLQPATAYPNVPPSSEP